MYTTSLTGLEGSHHEGFDQTKKGFLPHSYPSSPPVVDSRTTYWIQQESRSRRTITVRKTEFTRKTLVNPTRSTSDSYQIMSEHILVESGATSLQKTVELKGRHPDLCDGRAN